MKKKTYVCFEQNNSNSGGKTLAYNKSLSQLEFSCVHFCPRGG